jgi:hypothetical protein
MLFVDISAGYSTRKAGDWAQQVGCSRLLDPNCIKDIARALSETHPWKAPGEDLIPTGLIKACGRPLFQILAVLYTRCLELQWYPPRFKRAKQ